MTIQADRTPRVDRLVPAPGTDVMPDTPSPAVPGPLDWLTASQVAVRIARTPLRVRQLANEGKLRVTWTPLGRLFDPASVDALLRDREDRAATAATSLGAHG